MVLDSDQATSAVVNTSTAKLQRISILPSQYVTRYGDVAEVKRAMQCRPPILQVLHVEVYLWLFEKRVDKLARVVTMR